VGATVKDGGTWSKRPIMDRLRDEPTLPNLLSRCLNQVAFCTGFSLSGIPARNLNERNRDEKTPLFRPFYDSLLSLFTS